RMRDAPQEVLDARHDLARVERLEDVVVGAELEADDAVDVVLLAARDQDDPDLGFGPELTGERQAVRPGQADVQQDDVHVAAGEHLACLLDRAGLADRIALLFQVAGQQRARHRVVVYDEYLRLSGHCRSPFPRSRRARVPLFTRRLHTVTQCYRPLLPRLPGPAIRERAAPDGRARMRRRALRLAIAPPAAVSFALAFVLLPGSISLANAQEWNGSGPFPRAPGAAAQCALASCAPSFPSAFAITRSTEPVVIGWQPGRASAGTGTARASSSGVSASAS